MPLILIHLTAYYYYLIPVIEHSYNLAFLSEWLSPMALSVVIHTGR